MKKIREFFKKWAWVSIILVVAAAYFGDLYIQKGSTSKPMPAPVSQIATYKSIVPGVSTENELNKILGSPLAMTQNGNQTSLEYSSTNVYRHHIAIEENGKIVLIREIINSNDKVDAGSITNVYGKPPYTLYEKLSQSSFNLYVYPQNGIAYLGAFDGTLKEVWYFVPTTIEGFTTKWGQDFSKSPPSNEGVY